MMVEVYSKIVSIARTWIGTPYIHQHRTKGVGCDCLGLIIGVYEEYTDTTVEVPIHYTPDWNEDKKEETFLVNGLRYLKHIHRPEIGCVLMFRMHRDRPAKHAAIMTDTDKMIHAYQGPGKVVECHIGPWARRIAYTMKFPEI